MFFLLSRKHIQNTVNGEFLNFGEFDICGKIGVFRFKGGDF